MRLTIFDKDWSEKETESTREVVVETHLTRVRILEVAGVLRVTHERAASDPR